MTFVSSRFPVRIASILLCLLVFASVGFAATKKPLIYPYGLAVDAKGNLYVANSGGNDILVYSPAYAQVATKTITQGVSNPTGVAFDPSGNLWVANYGGGSGSVTEYIAGQQNTNATITDGILGPGAITTDSMGAIWVQNGSFNVTIYSPPVYVAPKPSLVRTLNFSSVSGIAIGAEMFWWGSRSAVSFVGSTPAVANGSLLPGFDFVGMTGFALTNDASGNIYMGNLDGTVFVSDLRYNTANQITTLPFTPYGIAVDSKRGRVYLSNYNGNSISVYSTAGALLTTIQ
jgi:DNA-binding beta-propeller fold protein YncE